jgi:hypothetical protein
VSEGTLNCPSQALDHFAECGREQGGIDVLRALQRFGVDGDVDQRVECAHRVDVAGCGLLNAQVPGLQLFDPQVSLLFI